MSRGQKIILISQTDRLTDSEAYILLGISIGSDRTVWWIVRLSKSLCAIDTHKNSTSASEEEYGGGRRLGGGVTRAISCCASVQVCKGRKLLSGRWTGICRYWTNEREAFRPETVWRSWRCRNVLFVYSKWVTAGTAEWEMQEVLGFTLG